MSLTVVTEQLKVWADASATKARRANDPDSIKALEQAAAQFQRLSALVQAGITELAAYRAHPVRKAATVRPTGRMTAVEFWGRHGQAVQAIIGKFGLNWKIKAPFGETELAIVPSGWHSGKMVSGTRIRWPGDLRVPAARFWPDGHIPSALTIEPDYPRASGVDQAVERWKTAAKWFRQALRDRRIRFSKPWVEEAWRAADLEYGLGKVRETREALRALGATPGYRQPTGAHDDAWYKARGYVWNYDDWRPEIMVRDQRNREEAIEAAREFKRQAALARAAWTYGPQPYRDVEGDGMLEAAD